ncbi:MAG: AsmA-like C-terminal region-containing protein [Bacteroidia bacterium]|nr:AsmA-like C-terminal region-containing protein [Bacteroidia bacterium]
MRFLAGISLGVLLTIGLLGVGIYASKDAILEWFKGLLSHTFSANLSWRKIGIGSIWELPQFSIQVEEFLIRGRRGDTLFRAHKAWVYLNLWAVVFRKSYVVNKVRLEEPTLLIKYDKRGRSSWVEILPGGDSTKSSPWAVEKLIVKGGQFLYEDHVARFSLCLGIEQLRASIYHGVQAWEIESSTIGEVKYLSSQDKFWLKDHKYSLKSLIIYDQNWLIAKSLHLGINGLMLKLEGGVRLKQNPPAVSLRLKQIALDMETMRRLWTGAPKELEHIPVSLTGKGEIIGDIGKGHLPRVHLWVSLKTKEPFQIRGYKLQKAFAKGELYWDPTKGRQSFLHLDTLLWRGAENDSLLGSVMYRWHTGKGKGHLRGTLSLRTLSDLGWVSADSLEGMLIVDHLAIDFSNKWEFSGEGELRDLHIEDGKIEKAYFRISPSTLFLKGVSLWYQQHWVYASDLIIENYARLWDTTTISPLRVRGRVNLPVLRLERIKAKQADKGSKIDLTHVELQVYAKIDTLYWLYRCYGPALIDFSGYGDSSYIKIHKIQGVGGGWGSMEICHGRSDSRVFWGVKGHFQNILLPKLYQEWPELDTLFPLMRHLEGSVSGEFQAMLPFKQGRIVWPELQGSLSLMLQDFVVVESPYTYKLLELVPLTDFRRIEVGRIKANISISEGVVRLDTTWLRANRWRMRVGGIHTLRGEIGYDLLIEVPRLLLDKSAERIQEWVEESEGERVRLSIRVEGTTQSPTFRWKVAKREKAQPAPPPKSKRERRKASLPVEEH